MLWKADPTTHLRVQGGDKLSAVDHEGLDMVSGRARRVRKGFHPRFDGGVECVELDTSKDVPPGTGNP